MVEIFFTDVAGLLLRRPSGHSHIETWVVIRFKNFTPKTSHRIFEHMHGILNKSMICNSDNTVVNREMNLMSLLNL